VRGTSSLSDLPLPLGESDGVRGNAMAGSPDPTAPKAAAYPFSDPLADPFVDVLSGESLRAKPPIRIPNDGPGGKTADGYGGGSGGSGGSGTKPSGESGTALLPPGTTFNLDGSPQTPVTSPSSLKAPAATSLVSNVPIAKGGGPIIVKPPSHPISPTQPVTGPTLPKGPRAATPDIAIVDPNGSNDSGGGGGGGVGNTLFDMTTGLLAWTQPPAGGPFQAQPPTIDPVFGTPQAPPAPAPKGAGVIPDPTSALPPATVGVADPETGNLTVTAGGNIPSYTNHLTNASANGSAVPDLSSLPLDAGATNPTPALVYASNTVNVLPIIQVAVYTNDLGYGEYVAATLTWNGHSQSTVDFTVAGTSGNNVIDLQVASPVTASGLYPFDVKIKEPSINYFQA
jgi:hypothetical protein